MADTTTGAPWQLAGLTELTALVASAALVVALAASPVGAVPYETDELVGVAVGHPHLHLPHVAAWWRIRDDRLHDASAAVLERRAAGNEGHLLARTMNSAASSSEVQAHLHMLAGVG